MIASLLCSMSPEATALNPGGALHGAARELLQERHLYGKEDHKKEEKTTTPEPTTPTWGSWALMDGAMPASDIADAWGTTVTTTPPKTYGNHKKQWGASTKTKEATKEPEYYDKLHPLYKKHLKHFKKTDAPAETMEATTEPKFYDKLHPLYKKHLKHFKKTDAPAETMEATTEPEFYDKLHPLYKKHLKHFKKTDAPAETMEATTEPKFYDKLWGSWFKKKDAPETKEATKEPKYDWKDDLFDLKLDSKLDSKLWWIDAYDILDKRSAPLMKAPIDLFKEYEYDIPEAPGPAPVLEPKKDSKYDAKNDYKYEDKAYKYDDKEDYKYDEKTCETYKVTRKASGWDTYEYCWKAAHALCEKSKLLYFSCFWKEYGA
eukprot:jgi/Tetstr1/458952/TSEL_004423.t1